MCITSRHNQIFFYLNFLIFTIKIEKFLLYFFLEIKINFYKINNIFLILK